MYVQPTNIEVKEVEQLTSKILMNLPTSKPSFLSLENLDYCDVME
jgi:hypothetical protein